MKCFSVYLIQKLEKKSSLYFSGKSNPNPQLSKNTKKIVNGMLGINFLLSVCE